MSHPRPSILLRHALDELSAEQHLAVEEHVGSCAACRARLRDERRIDEALAQGEPAPPSAGARRAAFDRLWQRVDARGLPRPEPAARRPHHGLRAALAAAALLLLALGIWQAWPMRDRSAGEPAVATADPALPGKRNLAPRVLPARLRDAPHAPPAPEAGVDGERLALARHQVAAALLQAEAQFPLNDRDFAQACELSLQPLRVQGWSVTHLVRGHALGRDPAARAAALRWSVLDPSSTEAVAQALERRGRTNEVLACLEEHPVDLRRTPGLARALGRVAGLRPDAPANETTLRALGLLQRGHGDEILRGLLERAVARALRRAAHEPATSRALAILEHALVGARVDALFDLAASPAHEALARERFLALSRADAGAVTAAVGEVLSRRGLPAPGLAWLVASGLHDLAPHLLRGLQEQSGNPALQEALAALAGPAQAAPLFRLWREHRDRPAGAGLRDLTLRLLEQRAARCALGAAAGPRELDDLVQLVAQLPGETRGEVLLACLDGLPAAADAGGHRAFLLTSLARLGGPPDGLALLAWIAAAGEEQRPLLPLAWATASLLSADASLLEWQGEGRDPRVLRQVAEARGAWPEFSQHPPRRLLRRLDRSLTRASDQAPKEES